MNTEDYLIHELAEKAGISVRTIRYYISEGLLPAPDTKGRYATFSEEYRLRLELILKLKDAFLPLKEIRDRIVGLDQTQIKELLDQFDAANANNLNAMIASDAPAHEVKERPLTGALDYLANMLGDQQLAKSPRNIPAPLVQPQRRSNAEVETWQRISLAPGLELHVRPAEEPYYRERIRQIVEFARIQFS
ncbi:MAG: MerR family transcriptional regulator [Bellilinea sp.]